MAWRLALAALLILAVLGPARASDPFASLSLQDRSIARALHAAQDRGPGMRPLSLDQIATLKVIGESWDEIFIGMRADGLVHAPDLASLIRGGDPGNAAARPQPDPADAAEPVTLPPEPPAMDRPLDRPAPRTVSRPPAKATGEPPPPRVATTPPPRVDESPPPRRHRYGGRDVGIFDGLGRPFNAD